MADRNRFAMIMKDGAIYKDPVGLRRARCGSRRSRHGAACPQYNDGAR